MTWRNETRADERDILRVSVGRLPARVVRLFVGLFDRLVIVRPSVTSCHELVVT